MIQSPLRCLPLLGGTLTVFIGIVLSRAEVHADVGTIYSSRNYWLAAPHDALDSEDFESITAGWNSTPAIRPWGTIESSRANPYAILIDDKPTNVLDHKCLEVGASILTLRPSEQTLSLVALGFDYSGVLELQLFNQSGQPFLTIDPESVYIFRQAPRFFGWAATPGQTVSQFTITSLVGLSRMDDMSFGFVAVPEPNLIAIVSTALLAWKIRRRR